MFRKGQISFKVVSAIVIAVFAITLLAADLFRLNSGEAALPGLPGPTELVKLSAYNSFAFLRGLRIAVDSPLHIDFIVDSADQDDVSEQEASRLISYFLAGLTVPDQDLWVNLSPDEQDRVLADGMETTELGRDLLAQDYLLKQLASSLTHPDTPTGEAYWRVENGKSTIENRLGKIWIVPDKAEVYEQGTTVVITEASLKLQCEDQSQQVLLPVITKDVNEGRNFARLRQIYHSLILAKWFKAKLKDSLYAAYIDQHKLRGIDTSDPALKEKIFALYVESFQKGVYDIIRSDSVSDQFSILDSQFSKNRRRRFFSGGVDLGERLSSALTSGERLEEMPGQGKTFEFGVDLETTGVMFGEVVTTRQKSFPVNWPRWPKGDKARNSQAWLDYFKAVCGVVESLDSEHTWTIDEPVKIEHDDGTVEVVVKEKNNVTPGDWLVHKLQNALTKYVIALDLYKEGVRHPKFAEYQMAFRQHLTKFKIIAGTPRETFARLPEELKPQFDHERNVVYAAQGWVFPHQVFWLDPQAEEKFRVYQRAVRRLDSITQILEALAGVKVSSSAVTLDPGVPPAHTNMGEVNMTPPDNREKPEEKGHRVEPLEQPASSGDALRRQPEPPAGGSKAPGPLGRNIDVSASALLETPEQKALVDEASKLMTETIPAILGKIGRLDPKETSVWTEVPRHPGYVRKQSFGGWVEFDLRQAMQHLMIHLALRRRFSAPVVLATYENWMSDLQKGFQKFENAVNSETSSDTMKEISRELVSEMSVYEDQYTYKNFTEELDAIRIAVAPLELQAQEPEPRVAELTRDDFLQMLGDKRDNDGRDDEHAVNHVSRGCFFLTHVFGKENSSGDGLSRFREFKRLVQEELLPQVDRLEAVVRQLVPLIEADKAASSLGDDGKRARPGALAKTIQALRLRRKSLRIYATRLKQKPYDHVIWGKVVDRVRSLDQLMGNWRTRDAGLAHLYETYVSGQVTQTNVRNKVISPIVAYVELAVARQNSRLFDTARRSLEDLIGDEGWINRMIDDVRALQNAAPQVERKRFTPELYGLLHQMLVFDESLEQADDRQLEAVAAAAADIRARLAERVTAFRTALSESFKSSDLSQPVLDQLRSLGEALDAESEMAFQETRDSSVYPEVANAVYQQIRLILTPLILQMDLTQESQSAPDVLVAALGRAVEKIDALDFWLAERAGQASSGLDGEANVTRGGIDLDDIAVRVSSSGLPVSLPGMIGKNFTGFCFRITGKRLIDDPDSLLAYR